MTTDAALHEKREALKRRLAAGEYRTLIDVLLAGISRIIQKITHNPRPISPWYSSLILFLVVLLTGFAFTILLGDVSNFTTLQVTAVFIPLSILIGYLAVGSMVTNNIYVHRVFTTIHDSVLDAAESSATVDSVEHWLTAVCDRKAHLIMAVVGGVAGGIFLLSIFRVATGIPLPSAIAVETLLVSVASFAFLYLLFFMVVLSTRVGRYHLKLYAADPSSSEVIGRLADLLSGFVYLAAIYAALVTLIMALAGFGLQASVGVLGPILWIPIIAMFILNQTSLSSIIRRAKWKTLNEIQARVEQLHGADSLADKDTMDAINRLMDYHDRIKGTRNSAFDLRAFLSLVNSLLLPFLALLLANLDKVLALFQ